MKHRSLEVSAAAAINWPALSFSQNLIAVEHSLEAEASRLGLRKRFFDDMLLVDSQGHTFRVVGAERTRLLPPRPQLLVSDILGFVTFNPRYAVRMIVADMDSQAISIETLRSMILETIGSDPSWEQMVDLEEFKQEVAAAASIPELIALF